MKHQATNFKKKYNEPMIRDLDEKESSKNKEFIGRRTGKNLGDHIANGNDFLLKNDYTDILETQKRDMFDLYSSDSGTEMSSSQDEDASESESEAEESERENSSNQVETVYTKNDSDSKIKKRVNPTVINFKEKNNLSKVVVNLKDKKTENIKNSQNLEEKYKNLESKLLKNSPIHDISDVEDENEVKTESESESEEETPMFNRYNKNPVVESNANLPKIAKTKTNPPLQTSAKVLPKISAKNNFKSNRKELWTDKDENKIESNKKRESVESSAKKETKNKLNPNKNVNLKNKKIDESVESLDLKNSKPQVDDTFDKKIEKESSMKKVGVPKSLGKKGSNLKDKHLLNTNLSTIKKDHNTSNLLTDNEFLKEEEEKVKTKKNLIEKQNKEKNINPIPVNNYDEDDYLGVDNKDNNSSNTLSLSDQEKDSGKEEKKISNISNNQSEKNVVKEANNKANVKDKENVTTAKKSKIAIIKKEKNSPKKENKKLPQKVNENNKENIKKLSPSKNEKNPKKKKFSQFREENLSDYENEENNKKIRRVAGPPKGIMTENERLKRSYQYMLSVEPKRIEIQKANEKAFGMDGRYSMRNRIPKLNHIAGDRVIYELVWDNEINMYVNEMKYIYTNSVNLESFKENFQNKKQKKKKLVKGLKKLSQNYEIKENEKPVDKEPKEEEEDEEEDDVKNLPEKFEDENINGINILRVYPRSQKKETKNFDVFIKGKVIEAYGKNSIILGTKKLDNLKKNDTFEILPLVRFAFLNYSKRDLRIKLEIIEDKN